MNQAKRLKELEQENSKLKRRMAELSLAILRTSPGDTSKPGAAPDRSGACPARRGKHFSAGAEGQNGGSK